MAERLGPGRPRTSSCSGWRPPASPASLRTVEDPLFGPVVSFGLGGVATELLDDWSHGIPPLTDTDLHDLVRSVRAAPLLFGHRGSDPGRHGALEDLLARVARLADDLPEVAVLELNPVVVGADGPSVLGATGRLARPRGPHRPRRAGAARVTLGRRAAPRAGRCKDDVMTDTSLAGLRAAIQHAGYYPELVAEAVDSSVAGEPIEAFVVHQETTFDSDEVRRHITVLVLTPDRLVLGHADDHPADPLTPAPFVTSSTEAVPLSSVRSVVVNRVVTDPLRHRGGAPPQEVTVTIGWGAVSRIDLEPAACSDPECEADHGYTGTASADDIALRVSEAAEGADAVSRMLGFAAALSRATAR